MIVVDTNVITYLCLGGDQAPLAERVLHQDSEWHAPLLWRSEFQNILAGYLRRELIDLEQAVDIASEARILLHEREYEISPAEVLRLVESSKCSAYDCEFVALAQHLETLLVTNDREILQAFPAVARSMSDFLRGAS